MEFKQSLAQRIIIAFALMSALVAGAFAMGIVATVHLVEEKLISAGLGGDLQRLLLMDSVEDWSHRPEPESCRASESETGSTSVAGAAISNCPRICATWSRVFTRCFASRCRTTPWSK